VNNKARQQAAELARVMRRGTGREWFHVGTCKGDVESETREAEERDVQMRLAAEIKRGWKSAS
jgi:hypothetical protein